MSTPITFEKNAASLVQLTAMCEATTKKIYLRFRCRESNYCITHDPNARSTSDPINFRTIKFEFKCKFFRERIKILQVYF